MNKTYVLELLKPTKTKGDLIESNIVQSQKNRINIAEKLGKEQRALSSKHFHELLPSAVINQNIREVKALYKLFRKSGSDKKSLDFKLNQPLCYNNQNYKIKDHFVSVPLFGNKSKRYWFPLVQNSRLDELKAHIANGCKLGKACLFNKRGKYYFAVTIGIVDKKMTTNNVMGIDIGINQLAVASVKDREGREVARQFHSGRHAAYIRRKYSVKRRWLGKHKKLKKIKQLNNKESRYITDLNHKISRKLVNLAVQEGVSIIVMEELKGIRNLWSLKRHDKSLNSWAFFELQGFIEYKAKFAGIDVVYINPKYTSQRCSACGLVDKSNRKKNLYTCQCGNRLHADLNASRNIAEEVFSSGNSLSA